MLRVCWAVCLSTFAVVVIACGAKPPAADTGAPSPAATADVRKRYEERVEKERKARQESKQKALDAAPVKIAEAEDDLKKAAAKYATAKAAKSKDEKALKDQADQAAQRVIAIKKERDKLQEDLKTIGRWVLRTNPHELKADEITRFGVDDTQMPVFVIFQRIDGSNALVKFGDEIFWVEGMSILSADEKKTVSFEGVIEATGTKEYLTPLNKKQAVRSFRHHPDEKK